MKTKPQPYDIIGDLHGYAEPLRALLAKLGYVESGGFYSHPERKVIFIGDFIDRGPKIRETLQIVKAMTDAGTALAVMGNHEYNAICYHTPDGNGGYYRPHTEEKTAQHEATLRAFEGRETILARRLEWAGGKMRYVTAMPAIDSRRCLTPRRSRSRWVTHPKSSFDTTASW